MSDIYIGEIRAFAISFTPKGWLPCIGLILDKNKYEDLHKVIGYSYGGSGNNFHIPDLRGRTPMGYGQGVGLQKREIGQKIGTQFISDVPTHTHNFTEFSGKLMAYYNKDEKAEEQSPEDNCFTISEGKDYIDKSPNVAMASGSVEISGETDSGGKSGNLINYQPSLAINYCIAYKGIFPQK